MSKLLINEPPLQVLPTLACAIGLNEAIFAQQLHYWTVNRNVSGKIADGKKWIGNSVEEWKRTNFPFWSTDTIQRTIKSVVNQGIVLVRSDLNSNKFDKKNWYAIDYDVLNRLPQDAVIEDPYFAVIDDSKMLPSYIETSSTETNKREAAPPPPPTAAHLGYRNKHHQVSAEFMEGMQEAGVDKEQANVLVYYLADIAGKKSLVEEDDLILNEFRSAALILAKWGYTTKDSLDCLASTCRTNPNIEWKWKKNKDASTLPGDMKATAGLVKENKLALLTAGVTTTPSVAKEVKTTTIMLRGKQEVVEIYDEKRHLYRDPEMPCIIIDDTAKQRGFDEELFEAMYVTKSSH